MECQARAGAISAIIPATAAEHRGATRRSRRCGQALWTQSNPHQAAVIAGLDPAIHHFWKMFLTKEMDARVISAFTRVFDALLPAHDRLASPQLVAAMLTSRASLTIAATSSR